MAINNPYQAYQQNKFDTASPGELTLMLFDGCLKFISKAKKAMEDKNIEERNINLTKSQSIIRELMVTLKMESEVAKNMMKMYDFILNHLIEANIQNDMKKLREAEELIGEFRDTWKEVILLERKRIHGAQGQV